MKLGLALYVTSASPLGRQLTSKHEAEATSTGSLDPGLVIVCSRHLLFEPKVSYELPVLALSRQSPLTLATT